MVERRYLCAREIWVKAFEDRKPDGRPRWLLRATVAGWIALHARADATRAVVGVRVLVDVTGMSERTVRTALAEVKVEGWLLVRERGHYRRGVGATATVYDLTIPEFLQATYGWPVDKSSTGNETGSTGNETGSTGNENAQNVDPQAYPRYPQQPRARGSTGNDDTAAIALLAQRPDVRNAARLWTTLADEERDEWRAKAATVAVERERLERDDTLRRAGRPCHRCAVRYIGEVCPQCHAPREAVA